MIPETLNYTWTYEAENGENRTITTSVAYSLFQSDPVEVKKLAKPMAMELQFSKKPESVELLFWEDSLLGQDSTAQVPEGSTAEVKENDNGNLEFTAQPGSVYLVKAQWDQGTAEYGFWVPSE